MSEFNSEITRRADLAAYLCILIAMAQDVPWDRDELVLRWGSCARKARLGRHWINRSALVRKSRRAAVGIVGAIPMMNEAYRFTFSSSFLLRAHAQRAVYAVDTGPREQGTPAGLFGLRILNASSSAVIANYALDEFDAAPGAGALHMREQDGFFISSGMQTFAEERETANGKLCKSYTECR